MSSSHRSEHELTILSTLRTIERGGYVVKWIRPAGKDGTHTFTAITQENERFMVKGENPLEALGELMRQLGFEDLD